MTRHLRMLGLISVAMLALFTAPAMVAAQTPTQDQYEPAPDADPDSGVNPDTATGDDTNPAVDVNAADANGKLPFTGGSVPLVVLIGLALLAAGLLGTAATRKRSSASP